MRHKIKKCHKGKEISYFAINNGPSMIFQGKTPEEDLQGLRGLSEAPFTLKDPLDTCKAHSGVCLRSLFLGHH